MDIPYHQAGLEKISSKILEGRRMELNDGRSVEAFFCEDGFLIKIRRPVEGDNTSLLSFGLTIEGANALADCLCSLLLKTEKLPDNYFKSFQGFEHKENN